MIPEIEQHIQRIATAYSTSAMYTKFTSTCKQDHNHAPTCISNRTRLPPPTVSISMTLKDAHSQTIASYRNKRRRRRADSIDVASILAQLRA